MCLPCCKKDQDALDKAAFYEPAIPVIFKNAKLAGLKEGVSLIITGTMKPSSTIQSIYIHLICDEKNTDQALFINPRTVIKIFIANTKIRKKWGEEIIYQLRPFVIKDGKDFGIQIHITEKCYLVAANGFHFAEYKHLIPYKDVKIIVVKGDVQNIQVERAVVEFYPERWPESEPKDIPRVGNFTIKKCGCDDEKSDDEEENVDALGGACELRPKHQDSDKNSRQASSNDKNVDNIDTIKSANALENEMELLGQFPWLGSPISADEEGTPLAYYGHLPTKYFTTGRCLRIDGVVHFTARSIRIALQKTPNVWPQPNVAFLLQFHFSVKERKFGDFYSVTSYNNGKWKENPLNELNEKMGVQKGNAFILFIVNASKAFEVYSKGGLLSRYEYSAPGIEFDTLFIQGDFKLTNVTMLSEFKTT